MTRWDGPPPYPGTFIFPRTDLQVTLDGVTIRPTLALGGWTAFPAPH